MSEQATWKILIYLCGDAADRLRAPLPEKDIDLGPLLNQPAGALAKAGATLILQAHLRSTRQAIRLVQEPDQDKARAVAVVENAVDSPAGRDAFVTWAMATYPTDRSLLFLADCKAMAEQRFPLPGTAFELVPSPDGPDQHPLTQEILEAIKAEAATRGTLGQLLSRLLSVLFGETGSQQPATPAGPVLDSQPKETTPVQPQRDWTILLYMAGDNGRVFETKYGQYSLMAEMTSAGHADIGEIQKVGTTERVAVLAQFDTLGEKGTYRLEIREGRTTMEDVVETIPEANTGDPSALARFIVWGMTRCPARHTMLVLWNHGLGWKDDDIYQSVRSLSRSVRSGLRLRQRNAASFRSTARKIKPMAEDPDLDEETRGILCDDTSMDFLTNVELSQALRVAEVASDEAEVSAIFGDEARLRQLMAEPNSNVRRRLSLIGMDACLMAMIEVQYQVRHYADLMVASQEVEPMNGWPYTQIVQKLVARPDISPQEFARLIVSEYVRSYSGTRSSNVTQSAVALARMEQTRQLAQEFALAVAAEYNRDRDLKLAYSEAQDSVRGTFEDPEYVDLAGFARTLLDAYSGGRNSAVERAGRALLDYLLDTRNGPVIENQATGKFRHKAHGISVYLSQRFNPPSPLYQTLDFAQPGWLDMLEAVRVR